MEEQPNMAALLKMLLDKLEDPEFLAEAEELGKKVELELAVNGSYKDPATGLEFTHEEEGGFTLKLPEPSREE